MIPSALAAQLTRGLADFLRFSFASTTPGMERVVEDFLAEAGGVLRGPYVSLSLPFVAGKDPNYFPNIPLPFTPHAHQEHAFERLGARRKRSTLVATGTGSGKTESFLVPILDHCLAEADRPGIKAILIYPMNALATDQAGRIAQLIHDNDRLRGRVRAGLYIGESRKGKRGAVREMGATQIINDREHLQNEPPDILLTNYKMLDYLLLRPKDQRIWAHNLRGILRFLVVDELHTFDGAQGTDLACLIRRLKRRLQVDDGSLCCVGTSATLGGSEAAVRLRGYAEAVFGEPFDADAVVTESRINAAQFLGAAPAEHTDEPGPDDGVALDPAQADDREAWVRAQVELWLGSIHEAPDADTWAVVLGERLRGHAAFRALVMALAAGTRSVEDLALELGRARGRWREDPALGRGAVLSLLALVSVARRWRDELPDVRARREQADKPRPTTRLVDMRLQLWQRELRRMVLSVDKHPRLRFSDDLPRDQRRRHLPAVHCRDCGAMGWTTRLDRDASRVLRTDLPSFYRAFFTKDPQVAFVFPAAAVRHDDGEWAKARRLTIDTRRLVALQPDEQPDGPTLDVVLPPNTRPRDGTRVLHRNCPFCGARESLALVGFRAATLTSVHIDQLFASRFNEDKKLLTFSDSVQDASHRAGFFGARTWRTNLRIAMVQVLRERDSLTLAELAEAVIDTWQQRLDPVTWVSTFIAPNMLWLHDWDDLRAKGTLPKGSDLAELVARRLRFEVVTELSLHANLGRSLPRTGSATALVDPVRLEAVVQRLLEPMRNELPGLRELPEADLRRFVVGLLHGLRLRGGVSHPELPQRYIESGGRDTYVYTQWVHLPSYGRSARLPALLTDRSGSARFDTYEGPAAGSWYARWVDRCLGRDGALTADASSTYGLVLPALVTEGLLVEHQGSRGERIWSIGESALRVTREVATARCDTCGHLALVAWAEAEPWEGMRCATGRCPGRHTVAEPSAIDSDYFGRLYALGDLQRIFTAEHTGLLDRLDREETEKAFKAPKPPPGTSIAELLDDAKPRRRRPWDPNLLSCTPTLEMGIDIGELSSTFLCSVPPAQANYLQRIGRAGRRDGNSLVLTVANARPHDQYFYAQPQEMMSGDVLPPGVFLDAAAVLERQLTAFCFDRWVATAPPEQPVELPPRLREVLASVATEGSTKFPYDLFAFIEQQQAGLLREFGEMFAGAIGDATSEHLRRFLLGGDDGEHGLAWGVLEALTTELKQRDSLQADLGRSRKELERLRSMEAQPQDLEERIRQLEDEKAARAALVRGINQRLTLEFFTDAGVLPNYAFPESAVRLSSVIWRRKKPPHTGGPYDTWTYDYVRSPANALSELAPNAEFYADGRRVKIDQIDVASTDVETWRFCNACSRAESVDMGDHHDSCPDCGSTTWRDDGQKLRLLRLRQVFANAPDRGSRIRDDRDERQPRFFQREILVHADAPPAGAWQLDGSLPFGFEYLPRATFRDVNFGEFRDQGAKTTINGRRTRRPGFEICSRCGKVQSGRPNDPPEHALTCPSRKKGAKVELEMCLYLYREFSSEALRLLLPMTDMSVQQGLSSFVAALELGLRELFGGRVDHLRTTVYDEPVQGSSLRRQYLVLYDTVPGGTGYVHQLVTPDADGRMPLFDVLARAKHRIESCVCWVDPRRDGCYRCLYAYRRSREMDDTSAKRAVELLGQLLDEHDHGTLLPIETVGSISINGLMDSVLELRFIESLRHARAGGVAARVEEKIVGGKPGYRLALGDNEWMIEPQTMVSATMESRADFVLHPSGAGRDRKPIVVYLDGWEHHKVNIGFDLALRSALQASGNYDVWSFTWYDIEVVLNGRSSVEPLNLVHPKPSTLRSFLQSAGLKDHKEIAERPLLEVFFDELARAEPAPWEEIGRTILYSRMSAAHASHRRAWREAVSEQVPQPDRKAWRALDPRTAIDEEDEPASEHFSMHAVLDSDKQLAAIAHLDDDPECLEEPGYRSVWNGVIQLFTLLRAVPEMWFTTREAIESRADLYDVVWRQRNPPELPLWAELELIDVGFEAFARALMNAGVAEPRVGWEIPDTRNDTWTEAELVWEDQRVALVGRDAIVEARGEPAKGWQIFVLEDLAGDPTSLIAVLS